MPIFPQFCDCDVDICFKVFSICQPSWCSNAKGDKNKVRIFAFAVGNSGTGSASENPGSGYTNQNWYAQILVQVSPGYESITVVAKTIRKNDSSIIKGKI
jgi:hypothetical protein